MLNRRVFLTLILSFLAVVAYSLFNTKTLEATIYGTISGHIVAEDTGEGLKNVEVTLYSINATGGKQLINRKNAFFARFLTGYLITFFPGGTSLIFI